MYDDTTNVPDDDSTDPADDDSVTTIEGEPVPIADTDHTYHPKFDSVCVACAEHETLIDGNVCLGCHGDLFGLPNTADHPHAHDFLVYDIDEAFDVVGTGCVFPSGRVAFERGETWRMYEGVDAMREDHTRSTRFIFR